MTLEELARELATGRLRPAYLLLGDEPLLREDALAALRAAALGAADPSFDLDRLEGASASAVALRDAVRTLPVLAPRRLVVLAEPEARRGGGGLGDALATLLGELDASPPEAGAQRAVGERSSAGDDQPTLLVVTAARADRRSRWVKAFGDAVVACEAPRRSDEVAAFVRAEAARQNVALEQGVAEALAERAGPHLLWLRQELAKLALLAGPGEPVSRAHVEAGTTLAAEEPVWDLTDAIGEGRAADALRVLARLVDAGAPPPVVLGALASHVRRLLRCASGADVTGPPFVKRKLGAQAQRYGVLRLRRALGAIHETDLALKGAGVLSPERALERLVIALAA